MVAVDPRGVARSEPVTCLTGKEMDEYTQVDQTPDDAGEKSRLAASLKDFAKGCEKRSGEILPHVSTVEAARDMDILRAVLGDEKLSYVGASYGTFLGATYAELFPERVGRLVLDGAMDPSLPSRQMNRDQTGASRPRSSPSPPTASSARTARSAPRRRRTPPGGSRHSSPGSTPSPSRPARAASSASRWRRRE